MLYEQVRAPLHAKFSQDRDGRDDVHLCRLRPRSLQSCIPRCTSVQWGLRSAADRADPASSMLVFD